MWPRLSHGRELKRREGSSLVVELKICHVVYECSHDYLLKVDEKNLIYEKEPSIQWSCSEEFNEIFTQF